MSKRTNEDAQVPDVTPPLEATEDTIRLRAYELFEEHGREDGHDVEDWLEAEAELAGKKPGARADLKVSAHKVA